MASLSNDGGLRRIQFIAPDGKRQAIRLGRMPLNQARTILAHVEHLVAAKFGGTAIAPQTAVWLAEIGDALRDRLVVLGLAAPKTSTSAITLGELVDRYKTRPKWQELKPNSVMNETQCARRLLAHFGAERPIDAISEADADDYSAKLRLSKAKGGKGLSRSTARGACSAAHRLYRFAIKSRWTIRSPFEDTERGQASRGANVFVSDADCRKVLDKLPNSEWRLLFGLSRWGGLRVPSEPRLLRWVDVDWEHDRFLVHCPKTERHEGRETRWVPIFPELRPLFRERFEDAGEGDSLVLPVMARRDSHESAVRYAARLAGVGRWTRLWHSLRSTRQTELQEQFPAHVVCSWLGNTVGIAERHYLQTMDEHFQKAAHFAAQSASARPRTDETSSGSGAADALDSRTLSSAGVSGR